MINLRERKKLGKRGAVSFGNNAFTWIVIGLIVFGGTYLAKGTWNPLVWVPQTGAATPSESDLSADDEDVVETFSACPTTGVSPVALRLWDDFSSPTSAITGAPIYIKNMRTGIVFPTNVTSTGGYATLAGVPCGTGDDYVALAPFRNQSVALTAGSGSAESVPFKVSGVDTTVTLYTSRISALNSIVKDSASGLNEFLFASNAGSAGANSSTAFVLVNSTVVADVVAGTAFAVGTDGFLQKDIVLQAVTSNRYVTDEGRRTTSFTEPATKDDLNLGYIMCAQYLGTKDFDSNLEQISVGGNILTDMKSSLSTIDLQNQNISDSHKCYALPSTLSAGNTITINVREQSKGGINPSATSDIQYYFLAQHMVRSTANTNNFLTGYVHDLSTKPLLGIQYTRPAMRIDVS